MQHGSGFGKKDHHRPLLVTLYSQSLQPGSVHCALKIGNLSVLHLAAISFVGLASKNGCRLKISVPYVEKELNLRESFHCRITHDMKQS